MPRAHRLRVERGIFHLTQRCHNRASLLRFARDRDSYRTRIREALQQFDVSLLDYWLSCNHVHLLVEAQDRLEISALMRKMADEFAREYNITLTVLSRRKNDSPARIIAESNVTHHQRNRIERFNSASKVGSQRHRVNPNSKGPLAQNQSDSLTNSERNVHQAILSDCHTTVNAQTAAYSVTMALLLPQVSVEKRGKRKRVLDSGNG